MTKRVRKILIICAVALVVAIVAIILLSLGGNVVYDFSYANNLYKTSQQTSPSDNVKVLLQQTNNNGLLPVDEDFGYDKDCYAMNKGSVIEYTADVAVGGLYNLMVDYYVLGNGLYNTEMEIYVNDKLVCDRATLLALWRNEKDEFERDRYDNEIAPLPVRLTLWQQTRLQSYKFDQSISLPFAFESGTNKVVVKGLLGTALLGQLNIVSLTNVVAYEEYRSQYTQLATSGDTQVLQAETSMYRTESSTMPTSSRDVNVTPYETNSVLLNTIQPFSKGGISVSYQLNAAVEGDYKIALNYDNSAVANTTTFVKVLVDGVSPFGQLLNYPLPSTKGFTMHVLGQGGNDYLFRLSQGKHIITFETDASIYASLVDTLNDVNKQLNGIYLDLCKLAGLESDPNRLWEPEEDFPGVVEKLNNAITSVGQANVKLQQINGSSVNNQAMIFLQTAEKVLIGLVKKPQIIPNKNAILAEGSGSAVQSIANCISFLKGYDIHIDRFVVSPSATPIETREKNGFFKFWESVKQFFSSFSSKYSSSGDKDALQVWVNRPRMYLDTMQKLCDSTFTNTNGVKVNFSLMPDEGKIILSSAAKIAPDAVFGISNWLPYELGIRDLTVDLRGYDDYNKVISRFSPGALVPLIADGRGLGLPETQDFYVMYYRKDILDKFNIALPDTWDDVKSILPDLQRNGMNFYIPLSSSTASKSIMTTAPFIYQFGGSLFSDDGTKTTIDSEKSLNAIKMMTDFYTINGMSLQVNNFYDSFRNGTLPIGVSTFDTYIKLTNAAPEIMGKWGIALSPGVKDESGVVQRWQPGSSTSNIIMKGDKSDDAWKLLKWWTSVETQSAFGDRLRMFGSQYIWNSANLQAFDNSLILPDDKAVIIKQWEWMQEYPRVPGWYMVERELSNAWNSIVLQTKNPRTVIDDAVVKCNKELSRKLTEFGYMKDGVMIKPYKITTIEEIKSWIQAANN